MITDQFNCPDCGAHDYGLCAIDSYAGEEDATSWRESARIKWRNALAARPNAAGGKK